MHAVSNTEIVIMGGNDRHWNFMSDCHVFDIESQALKRVAMSNNLAIASGPIQVFRSAKNRVISVGRWNKSILEYHHIGDERGENLGNIETLCSFQKSSQF